RNSNPDPLRVAVDIESPVPDEAGQGEVEFLGQFQGHGGGGGDRRQDGDAGPGGLEGHFEADPAAEQGHHGGQVPLLQQGPADHLIHGVVTPHVFGHQKRVAAGGSQGHPVAAPGGSENGLGLLHAGRQGQQLVGGDGQGALHRGNLAEDFTHRLLGAQTATGVGHLQVAPASPGQGRFAQRDVHHVGGEQRVGGGAAKMEGDDLG